jgi:protease-4
MNNKLVQNIFLGTLLFTFLNVSNCIVAFNNLKLIDLPEKTIDLNEQLISGSGRDKILVISIEGVIMDTPESGVFGLSYGDSMVARVKEELSKASLDQDIKGVILKVDSPGGGVTASDIIYRELNLFKAQKKIPIVALFMDTAASGGYYVSMSADAIIAHPTTVTGSIGVIISGLNIKEGLDKIGIKDQSVTSGANKNILSPYSEFTPEKRKIIQSIVDNMYERFYSIVKKNRKKIDESKLKSLADGRIFTAEQAYQEGLVDGIGYAEDAIKKIMSLPNYKKNPGDDSPKIITYTHTKKNIKNFYQATSDIQSKSSLDVIADVLKKDRQAKFYYLWNL